MTAKLHAILVLHAAPKDSHSAIETYVIADDEDVILERVDSEFARDRWSERSAGGELFEIYDSSYNVIGEETFLERMKRLRGEYNDEDADFSDAHYGVTHFGWDEGKDVTPAEIEMLLALNVAQDWRVAAEGALPAGDGTATAGPMLTAKEAAAILNGGEYRCEGNEGLFETMKKVGLVAVFGASDDLVEFRGAIHDEQGNSTVYLTSEGLLRNECDDDECPYFEKLRAKAATIEPLYSGPIYEWEYETEIPHETFVIWEDGHKYCEGIVFALADVKAPA